MGSDTQIQAMAEAIAAIQMRIAAAAGRVGRSSEDVCLIGVTKTHPVERIALALAAGLQHIGENRVQEAVSKFEPISELYPHSTWHLIGHLQSNKARRAARLFDYIHSVDSVHVAMALNQAAAERPQGRLNILLQVNVSGEGSKQGFDLADWQTHSSLTEAWFHEVEQIVALPHLQLRGLMTIAPWGSDPEQARPHFVSCRMLRDALQQRFPEQPLIELSMGMSDDFELAIEEGATQVRVGRALFGERSSKL